jgi:hypothetical protein
MWETLARPQRVALTRFVGAEPIGQELPVLLDGFRDQRDIEFLLESLLIQSRPKRDKGQSYPPTVWRLRGPVHYPQKRWVLADIEFGEALRSRNLGGRLVRQRAVLKFIEYVPPDSMKVKRLPRRLTPKGKEKKVKADGRTLRRIAIKYYGTAKAARPLGKAQKPPIRDVTRKLPKGRVIRLPRIRLR